MSDDRHNQRGLNPDSHERRALEAMRRLPRVQASAEAKDKARAAFLAAAAPPRRSRFGVMSAFAAVATAAVLALFLFGRAPTEEWIVLDVVGPTEGIETPAGDTLAKGTRLKSGTLVTAGENELELQLGETLRFRMLPGTKIELPKAPGRWFDRDREMQLTSGEIYGTTGGNELGFQLDFKTDELTAVLTGTTFAVFRTPDRSCVCLWEGGILVTSAADPDNPTALEPGQRIWIFKDGRPREIAPLDGMETMKLQMTSDAGLADIPAETP